MNTAYQYLPEFVDGEPAIVQFTTQEELYAHEWISRWSKNELFIRYTLLPLPNHQDNKNFALGAELKHTPLAHGDKPWRNHWIAFLENDDGIQLGRPD